MLPISPIRYCAVGYRSQKLSTRKVGGNMFFTFVTAADKPRLDPALFQTLSTAFDTEPHLLPATAKELAKSFWDGLATLGLAQDGEPVFYCRLIWLAEDWYELGSTWTAKSYRGQGINKRAYEFFLPKHMEKNILATTKNRVSLDVGMLLGFVLCARAALSEAVWRATCSCPSKKMGAETADHCIFAWGETQHQAQEGTCWLRVTASTAERLRHKIAA